MGWEEGGRSVVGEGLGCLVEVGCGLGVSSEGSESGVARLVKGGWQGGLGVVSERWEETIPSALLRSARPLRRPAASALCFSRSFSRSRTSLSRVLRLLLLLVFFELPSPVLWLTPISSSESAFEGEFLLFRGDEDEPEFVRCRLISSLRLF